uniref:Zinc finger and BTB domain containing 5 n=1 Tax=Cyprinodon variegatus TaxID=28743 RepID=A0A3Q2FT58_CYPVA
PEALLAVMDFPGHFQHIFKQLNHQRLHTQLCDCMVVVGGQSFQAHRSILAASSSHFRALLTSSDEGSGAQHVMELDPEVVTPEAFSTLLDMIYTSTLTIGTSNAMDVLLAASHLHLNAVVKACKLHLSRKNFPASAPKGWRSVQQSPCSVAVTVPQHQVTSAAKGESDEIQLPTQSDSSTAGEWKMAEDKGGDAVVKVQAGEEERDEQKIVIELKKENISSFSNDFDAGPNKSPPSLLEAQIGDEKMPEAEAGGGTLPSQVCADVHTDMLTGSGELGGDTVEGEGLESFSELAFSLAPGSESSTDAPSASAGDASERPSLTRASEDVLSKCKKAAAEDHVLLVEGEKKYACKICCKTFMNLTDCKKHIRVHTGEKPYPCPKCGKRFSQSSHLYKHSKNTCMNWKDDQSFPDSLL